MSNLFNAVKVTELLPGSEIAANSTYHLLFYYLLRYVYSSFPLTFDIGFGF